MKKEHTTIGIITFPISQAGVVPLSNLVNIFYSLSDEIHLITGDAGYIFFVKNKKVHTY